jgi:hypothetical protein
MGRTNPSFTWMGQETPRPTDAECVQICIGNAEESAKAEQRAREWHARAERGTEDCDKAWQAVCRHVSDQKHWRELADWHRKRVQAAEREARRLAALGPPPEREREVGADDGDEPAVLEFESEAAAAEFTRELQAADAKVAAALEEDADESRLARRFVRDDDDDERLSPWQDIGAGARP